MNATGRLCPLPGAFRRVLCSVADPFQPWVRFPVNCPSRLQTTILDQADRVVAASMPAEARSPDVNKSGGGKEETQTLIPAQGEFLRGDGRHLHHQHLMQLKNIKITVDEILLCLSCFPHFFTCLSSLFVRILLCFVSRFSPCFRRHFPSLTVLVRSPVYLSYSFSCSSSLTCCHCQCFSFTAAFDFCI